MRKLTMINKRSESFIIAIIISIIILFFHFTLPKYKYNGFSGEFDYDILSYYLYLPLTFIKQNLFIDTEYTQQLVNYYHLSPTFYQADPAENGNWVMIYNMGMALLYLPFFLIAHAWAIIGGYPTDGFSFPYKFCISTGMYVYILSGIFILRKILLRFFKERIVSITLLLLILGTNYFREATDYNLGPHATLFAFYCLLIYYTIKWHDTPKKKYAFIIGIAIGFLSLIRPTEFISAFIPLLWGIFNKTSLLDKLRLIKNNWSHVLILIAAVFLVALPQMVYWKYLTDSLIYNGYKNQNSFDITEPHLMQILFSFRKGWFVYTPMIVFAFIGLFFLQKEKIQHSKYAIIIFLFFNISILTFVPIWWNAGSFGQRFMVQSYAVWAIPFASFIQFVSERKFILKTFIGILAFLMLCLNLFQTWQFVRWIIPGDGMTYAYYTKHFFKTTSMTKEDQKLLELQRPFDPNAKFDDNDTSYKKSVIAFFNMESTQSEFIDTLHALTGKRSFKLSSQANYSPGLDMPFSSVTHKDHAWFRLTFWYYPVFPMDSTHADAVIHFIHRDKVYLYAGWHIEEQPYQLNKWNKFTADYLSPPLLSDDEHQVKAYIWFRDGKEIYIDNIKIEAFVKKED